MIQEYITQYIYYETINMEHLQNELKLKMADRCRDIWPFWQWY